MGNQQSTVSWKARRSAAGLFPDVSARSDGAFSPRPTPPAAHVQITRPPSFEDLPRNLNWQWENNPGSIQAAIRMERIGNRAHSLFHLCDGQRHNADVVQDYRAFPDAAMAFVMRTFGPRVPEDGRRVSAPMPWTLACGHTDGECVGGHVGDVHTYSVPYPCRMCGYRTIETRHQH